MIAPRRAIGVPSAESSVIEGGVGGLSERDSGAVTASQPTATTNSTISTARPRIVQRRMRRRREGRRGRRLLVERRQPLVPIVQRAVDPVRIGILGKARAGVEHGCVLPYYNSARKPAPH